VLHRNGEGRDGRNGGRKAVRCSACRCQKAAHRPEIYVVDLSVLRVGVRDGPLQNDPKRNTLARTHARDYNVRET
jgi:hypothetical protein